MPGSFHDGAKSSPCLLNQQRSQSLSLLLFIAGSIHEPRSGESPFQDIYIIGNAVIFSYEDAES
jgi:hypothetical protein